MAAALLMPGIFLTGCPSAQFTANVTSGAAPLKVQFSNQSTRGIRPIRYWAWDFGDSQTSDQGAPEHIYTEPGTYTVSLTVISTTYGGSDILVKENYIVVSSHPEGEDEGEGQTDGEAEGEGEGEGDNDGEVEGQAEGQVEGQDEEGQAEEGQAEEGQAEEGQAEEGQAEEGQAEEGQAEEGQAEEGQDEGQAEEGQAEEGQVEEGQTEEGQAEEGQAEEGQGGEVTVSPSETFLEVGDTLALLASSDDAGEVFTWESSDDGVAVVNANGVVEGFSPGTVTITATAQGGGTAGTAVVKVVELLVAPDPGYVLLGDTLTLLATSSDPADTFTWSSGNTTVASVDSDGKVTGLSASTDPVQITAESVNTGFTASASVYVVDVSVNPGSGYVALLGTLPLAAVSSDPTDTFTWESGDDSVAEVDADGVVTGVSASTDPVEITVTAMNSGLSASATIYVVGIGVNPGVGYIGPGDTLNLSASSTYGDDDITWSSSNEGVATVNASGVVTGVAISGTPAVITATGTMSGIATSVMINVTGFVISPNPGYVGEGQTAVVSAPAGGYTLVWSSGDENIATVSSDGTVTGVRASSSPVTITVSREGTAEVAVGQLYVVRTEIAYSYEPLVLGTLDLSTDQLSVQSSLAADTGFTWSSSDEGIVIVSQSGALLAVAEGTATIQVTSNTSGVTTSVEVTVLAEKPGMKIWDGESGWTGVYGALNTSRPFRGAACLEGLPDAYHEPTISLTGYSSSRADISSFDEVWMYGAVSEVGKTFSFAITGQSYVSNKLVVDPYVLGAPLATSWRLIRIPIADLATADYSLNRIDSLSFGVANPTAGHSIYVDEIWAVRLDAFDPLNMGLLGAVSAQNFGDVNVDSVSLKHVVLGNLGTGPLTIQHVSITGTHANEFYANPAGFTIPAGMTRSLDVSFMPQSVLTKGTGDKSAALVLTHDLTPLGATTQLPLTGRAVSPAIDLSAESFDFGEVPEGLSATRSLTVSNPGNGTLHVSSVSASDPAFQATPASFDLAPDASQAVSIVFTPSAGDDLDEVLTVLSDATDSESVDISLTGVGLSGGSVGTLAVEPGAATSSSVTLSWGQISDAASVDIYLGPEPADTPGGDLPEQVLLGSVGGTETTYTVDGLAAAVDAFFHIQVRDGANALLAQGYAHARTVGGPRRELDNPVREVHLYAPNIIQVVITDNMVHSYTDQYDTDDGGINEIVGYTGSDWQTGTKGEEPEGKLACGPGEVLKAAETKADGGWTVLRGDGTPILVNDVHRQSIVVGQPYYDISPYRVYENRVDVDHLIYLVLDEDVGSPAVLHIEGPEVTRDTLTLALPPVSPEYGVEVFQPSFYLPFSDRYLETPVIQVNQVGYCPRATSRYAYVSGWMGDGGGLSLASFPSEATVLIEEEDPLAARTDALTGLSIALNSGNDPEAGGDVAEIDLAALPAAEGVVYRVRVPGVGVSWPTQVSETALLRAFYVTTRGMYLNRWGRDLQPQWTDWATRPPDHPVVYTSDIPEWWLETVAFSEDTPQVGARLYEGGHHDAGDFDIRPQHFLNALLLMRAFELNEAAFTDGQLTFPESGNGIPDLLDEVLWSLLGWEELQEEDGGIRAGLQSYSHPQRINYADADLMPYWTFSVDVAHTIRVAGMFAQASRLVEPYDADKAAELLERAERAYDYAWDNGVTELLGGPVMYAAGELYRATGETEYRDLFENMWRARDVFGDGPELYGFASWGFEGPEQAIYVDFILGYMNAEGADPVIRGQALDWLTERSGLAVDDVFHAHAHRNGRPETWDLLAGHGTAVGEYLMRVYARMQMGGLSEADRQEFIDAISLSVDFVLGCNPLGQVWITGLGSRSSPRAASPRFPVLCSGQRDEADTGYSGVWAGRIAEPGLVRLSAQADVSGLRAASGIAALYRFAECGLPE